MILRGNRKQSRNFNAQVISVEMSQKNTAVVWPDKRNEHHLAESKVLALAEGGPWIKHILYTYGNDCMSPQLFRLMPLSHDP
jgi:hypothetical protein